MPQDPNHDGIGSNDTDRDLLSRVRGETPLRDASGPTGTVRAPGQHLRPLASDSSLVTSPQRPFFQVSRTPLPRYAARVPGR